MNTICNDEILELHRELVGIPSVSHHEGEIVNWLDAWFQARDFRAERIGQNLLLEAGQGATLCLNSHLDTVPPGGWTRAPYPACREGGRVYGLGSNDAKASVAAMIAAFLNTVPMLDQLGIRLMLALVVEEETGGNGAELLVSKLSERDGLPDAVVVGEPTGLEVTIAQKGLMVLELSALGKPCHAAHRQARGLANPIRTLAADILRLDEVELGPEDPLLGPVTIEPTVLSGGKANNAIPAEVSCVLDIRTNPVPKPVDVVRGISNVVQGHVKIRSDRLRPCSTPRDHMLVQSAMAARPTSRLIGSRTLSDWVYFADLPAVKVGPGLTERSHTADEFVLESEILEGASYYHNLVKEYSERSTVKG